MNYFPVAFFVPCLSKGTYKSGMDKTGHKIQYNSMAKGECVSFSQSLNPSLPGLLNTRPPPNSLVFLP